jgi:glyoxylase-like metal-dependent hydrolase (beta-lactamase superfamily II)
MRSILDFLVWAAGGGFAVLAYLLYPSQSTNTVLNKPPKAAFHASRLTSTTFLIKEYNDIYSEHPHIYAKVVPAANTILIIDTGCGGASNDTDITIKSLKEFVETVEVDDNDGSPLNEGGKMGYVVALTHCHYDHICT